MCDAVKDQNVNKGVTPKERKGVLWKGMLIMLLFGATLILAAPFVPKEWQLLPPAVVIPVAIVVSFIYGVPRLVTDYEDAMRAYSGASMLVVMVVGFFLGLWLNEVGVEINVVPYMFGGIVPLSLVGTFATYEVLDHRRSRATLTFHFKRLAGRMVLVVVFVAFFFVLLNLLALVSQGADVSQVALVVSGIITALIAFLMLRKPGSREILRKLGEGNW
jgi:hypothetical protein